MDARTVFLDRIALLRRELDSLAALVEGVPAAFSAPVRAEAPAAPLSADEDWQDQDQDELPPEPAPRSAPKAARAPAPPAPIGQLGIDPAQAAQILGVARQTVDRRLKEGHTKVPGGPVDISKGSVRSRWRWGSEDQVRRWWEAVR